MLHSEADKSHSLAGSVGICRDQSAEQAGQLPSCRNSACPAVGPTLHRGTTKQAASGQQAVTAGRVQRVGRGLPCAGATPRPMHDTPPPAGPWLRPPPAAPPRAQCRPGAAACCGCPRPPPPAGPWQRRPPAARWPAPALPAAPGCVRCCWRLLQGAPVAAQPGGWQWVHPWVTARSAAPPAPAAPQTPAPAPEYGRGVSLGEVAGGQAGGQHPPCAALRSQSQQTVIGLESPTPAGHGLHGGCDWQHLRVRRLGMRGQGGCAGLPSATPRVHSPRQSPTHDRTPRHARCPAQAAMHTSAGDQLGGA